MSAIDLPIRAWVRSTYGIRWAEGDQRRNISALWSVNSTACIVLCLDGFITNVSLVGLIVSIPLYFFLGW